MEKAQLALGGLHLGEVEMEIAERIGVELLPGRLVGVLRQPRNAMALKAAMQRRALQMRDRGL
jgi:hypothetical protein